MYAAGWRRAWDRIDGWRNGWTAGLVGSVSGGWMDGWALAGFHNVTACASACMRLFVLLLGIIMIFTLRYGMTITSMSVGALVY